MTLRESATTTPSAPQPLTTDSLKTPSLRRRMACWMYEGMLLFGVIFIAGYLFSSLSQTRHAMDNRPGLQAFVFLTLGIYFTWFWHRGQTLAMKTWDIKLVSVHGHRVTQPRALLRYVLSWLWFLPPLVLTMPFGLSPGTVGFLICVWVMVWAWLSRFQAQKQFWHDAWAGTRLVTSR